MRSRPTYPTTRSAQPRPANLDTGILFALVVALLSGCRLNAAPPVDLVRLFAVAHVVPRVEQIVFDSDTDRTPLGRGWSANEPGFIWSVGDTSEIRFAWFAEGDIEGELSGKPYSESGSPQQIVSVSLNGHLVAEIAMNQEPGSYSFTLPASHLRTGENSLRFRYSYARPSAGPFRWGEEYRRLAVVFTRIRLLPKGKAEPSGYIPTVRLERDEIRQEAGTEFTYDIATAERPSIDFTVEAVPGAGGARTLTPVGGDSPAAGGDDSVGLLSVLWRSEEGAENALFETQFSLLSTGGETVGHRELPQSSRGALVFRLTGESGRVRWKALAFRDARPRFAGPPSMLLAVVDAMRGDHVGFYGYARDTTPNLDRIAREAVVFDHQIAQAPWTPPSFGTLFTGRLPHEHGAGYMPNEPKRFRMREVPAPLAQDVPTVAELLAARGYQTSIFYTSVVLRLGLLRGFEEVSSLGYPNEGHADELAERAAHYIWKQALADRPFYLVLDFSDTHEPLTPPAPFRTFSADYPQKPGVDLRAWAGLEFLAPPYGPDDRQKMLGKVALYDDAIRFVDSEIARVFQEAEAVAPLQPIYLFVTADHGEEFWEHAEQIRAESPGPGWNWGIGHGHSLYNELLRVPLLIWMNRGLAARRVRSVTQGIDIAPTMLRLAGIDPAALGLEGIDLLAVRVDRKRFAFSEYLGKRYEKKAIQSLDWKLIWTPFTKGMELYDLVRDPMETRNLAAERKEVVRELFALLQSMASTPPAFAPGAAAVSGEGGGAAPAALTPEQAESLRALGYID